MRIFSILSTVATLLLAIFFFSCSREKETPFREYNLASYLSDKKTVKLEDISADIQRIQLETTDESLIRYISKVIMTDKLFVVIHDNRCTLFDRNGNFIRNVGSIGQGPEEYVSASDVFVCENQIIFFDAQSRRILVHKQTGEFVDAFRAPEDVTDILPDGDGFIGHVANRGGQDMNRLKKIDSKGKAVDSIPGRQYESGGITMFLYPELALYRFGTQYTMKETCNDTVYTIHPDFTMTPRYTFSFGEVGITPETRHQMKNPRENILYGKKAISSILESPRYLFLQGFLDRDMLFLIDKKEDFLTYAFIRYAETEKKMFDKDYFLPHFISEDHTTLITSELVVDDENENNPVLVLVTLKT